MHKSWYTLFLATGVLAGCGGGSGGPTFDSLANEGIALLNEHSTTETTPLASMPDTGTASYHGVAAYSSFYSNPADIIADPDSLSEVQLQANFGASTISGSAYNFRSYDPEISLSGSIDLVNGTITGNQFGADLTGSITESGYGITATGTYSGSVTGEFGGPNADVVVGTGSAIGDYGAYGSIGVNTVFIAD